MLAFNTLMEVILRVLSIGGVNNYSPRRKLFGSANHCKQGDLEGSNPEITALKPLLSLFTVG